MLPKVMGVGFCICWSAGTLQATPNHVPAQVENVIALHLYPGASGLEKLALGGRFQIDLPNNSQRYGRFHLLLHL